MGIIKALENYIKINFMLQILFYISFCIRMTRVILIRKGILWDIIISVVAETFELLIRKILLEKKISIVNKENSFYNYW